MPQVTILQNNCQQAINTLLAADIVLTDPPYGIGYKVNERKLANRAGLKATPNTITTPRASVVGDNTPFDPTIWLQAKKVALFGANYFYPQLPIGGRWIVWDKRRDSAPDDHSDCEFIWTNVPGADRIHRQKWRGVIREGEENCSNSKKLHPNQKPVALLSFILQQLNAQPGMTIADPYMGCGSTGVAAVRLGCHFIGCEIDPGFFAIAQTRLKNETA